MSSSPFMEKLIRDTIDEKDAKSSEDKQNLSYVVETFSSKGTVATASFKLSRPVPEEELQKKGESALKYLADNLELGQLGVIDAILAQYALRGKVGRKRSAGNVKVSLGVSEDRELGTKALNAASGRFISNTNLRSLLEVTAKNYLIRDMKRPNAPLKYRTGRFANSLDVVRVGIDDNDTGRKPQVSVFYSFMTYPYAVFDPMRSSRPELYNRPSPGARNPQVLIGNAIAKAMRDIINTRYKLNVQEVRR